ELGLLPLAKAGLLDGATIYTQGITGSSGSGIAPQATTHHPTRAGNLRTYKPLEHQHIPEILQTLEAAGAKDVELRFVPVSAPLVRGIFVTSYVDVPESWTQEKVKALFVEQYAHERFVRVPKKRLPEVVAVAGSNYVEVGVAVSGVRNGRRTVTTFTVSDNLIKGGAGQAIQNMNLVLGLPEQLSLEDVGPFP
ncbi:MAG: Asd/ArgC dimerization domain-containing protein, partial [Myxococcales bacterium]